MKNKAAVSLGRIGGARNTAAQNETRAKNAIRAREVRAENRLKAKRKASKP